MLDIDINAKQITISYFIVTNKYADNVTLSLGDKSILYVTNKNYLLLKIEEKN